MDVLDMKLCRAWRLFATTGSVRVDEELERLLPELVAAGYVSEVGHSPTGSFWRFTESGARRAELLGCQ